jgi:hypothetical protein
MKTTCCVTSNKSASVAPLRHIILIPSQQVFALTPNCCLLSREATNTNFIVFGSTRPGLTKNRVIKNCRFYSLGVEQQLLTHSLNDKSLFF